MKTLSKSKFLTALKAAFIGSIAMPMFAHAQCGIAETPFNHGQNTPNSVWFTSDEVGYVVGSGISKTTDGGKSWSTLVNAPKVYLRSSMFLNPNVGYITGPTATANGKTPIWKTTDGGSTWNMTNTPADVTKQFYRGLYMVNENVGYAGLYADGVVIKTTDGLNWEKLPSFTNAAILGLYFKNEQVGFAGTTEGLFMTKDGGKTWDKKTPVQAQGPYIFSIHFSDTANGYAVGEDYFQSPKQGPIFRTKDGGENWELINQTVMRRIKDVFALSPDTAYVCGNGQLHNTFDGGLTWNKVVTSAKSELYDIHFPSKRVGYSIGDGNGNVKIVNGNPNPTVNFIVSLPSLVPNSVPGATYQWFKRSDTLATTPFDTIQGAVTPVFELTNPDTAFYSVCANLNGCEGCSKEILVKWTSIPDQLKSLMTVSPNPADEQVTVAVAGISGKISVSIINTLGQVVYAETYLAPSKSINTSTFPAGLYTVVVNTEKGTGTRRLIIK